MGFFTPNKQNEIEIKKEMRVETKLGRAITSINSAIEEMYKNIEPFDPVPYIDEAVRTNKTFYGRYHTGENAGEPFFLDEKDTTMEIYVGSTGTGKGVLLGNKALEAIKKRKGLIIIDPKTDGFLPEICKEELERQGRPNDFQVVSWPYNFGYDGINENDDYIAVSNKLIDAFGWEESDNPGVDYYRKKQRVMLKKVLKLFFDGTLGVLVKKDLNEIAFHIIKLAEDLSKQEQMEKELSKSNPNYNKINELEKRFFDTNKLLSVHWDDKAVETLESIAESFDELIQAGNIYKKYDLTGALYEGKVIYFKVDMLDISSLKMIKLMINDAIQQARAKKANTTIIADELSFYANSTIAGALATVRSMGLKFLLALQDLAQMKDEHIRNAILSNCNVKLFYKISDKLTLEYVEKIGGKELVTKYATGLNGESKIAQDQEEYLNATRIRALPRMFTAIVIAEALPKPEIINTSFVKVSREFDWDKYNKPDSFTLANINNKNKNKKKYNFETKVKEAKKLLENSDLYAIEFDTFPL
jgi:hypothetical protein